VQQPATKRAAVKTPATKVAASPKKTTTVTRNYVVKSGDSLWSISGKSMKKIRKIKELNGLKSDVIKPGQTLKIPA
jgi:LysM repeat protein